MAGSFISFFTTLIVIPNFIYAGSPYSLKAEREAVIFGLGASIGTTGFFLEENVKPLTAQEIETLNSKDVNFIDRSACKNFNTDLGNLSDICVYTLISTPSLLFLSSEIGNDFGTVASMYIQTLALLYALPSLSKGSISRVRPFVYNPDAPIEKKLTSDAQKSYFSGHTTAAFASAVFFSTVYSGYFPDSKYKGWIWGGALLAAATVGYLRYESGNHYPTDIITGAIIGSAIGYLIPYIHESGKNNNLNISSGKFENFTIGIALPF